ncbi:hypothetical protein NLQ99_24490, partial [Escherichia coli]|nr:hypothetical protein [Escherichia coli]
MSATSTPSLFGGSAPATAAADARESNPHARTLLDLLYDGFFMLFQLRNGQQPTSAEDFLSRVRAFLDDFDRGAK